MNFRAFGNILRLAGPLLQVVCLALLFGTTLPDRELAGTSVRTILYGGFALGLGLVVIGLAANVRGTS